jgi:mono/diheme cytochrome c family protein
MKVRWGHLFLACGAVLTQAGIQSAPGQSPAPARPAPAVASPRTASLPLAGSTVVAPPSQAFVNTYCATCHNQRVKAGGLALDALDIADVGTHGAEWEKVVVKLRAGLMPPAGMPRPDQAAIDGFASSLEAALDRAAAAKPNPGRTEPFHRLNRAEYQNAIRDLLDLDVDATAWLPTDEISYGFDNIAGVLKLSPLLTERYLNAAQKVARLALGTPAPANGDLYRVPDQLDQDVRLEGMPVGTRGGTRVDYLASRDGDYVIKVRLSRGIDYDIPYFIGEQQLEISVDGEQVKVFVVPATPGETLNYERQVAQPGRSPQVRGGDQRTRVDQRALAMARNSLDDDWTVQVPLKAGVHEIRATFLMKTGAVSEGFRKPFLKPYIGRGTDDERETREGAALREMEVMGPLNPGGGATLPSYQRVFVCRPAATTEETPCARTVLSKLARRAYRRPVTADDVNVLMGFYKEGRAAGTFDTGVELALQRILVSPSFLFRTEFDPPSASGVYRVSDLALASRLSFFLWSSIPDDELLDLAERNRLHEPAVLERQTRRMLADPRSEAFINNFAGQWLSLRRLPDIVPDPFLFPDYGDTLALGFRREVELFFGSIVREDRPATELLTADYTFVNERLAQHYGIPHVKGIAFRRVALPEDSPRRGLLGKGAILTVTAFPNRTSPVVRGKWVLQTLLGAPPPEPPPNVPGLPENGEKVTKVRTLRERLEQHRASATCASCHKLMDPLGFALENFDAVGKYRTYDENFEAIDNTGVYANGTRIEGAAGLRQILVDHSDQFLANITQTLLTYALGRGVEYYDAPAVRRILRDGAPQNHRFSSIVLGIVKSMPFQMRRSDS